MSVTSAQIRMARAALDWTVRDLAKAAGLHRNTITNIERGRGGDPTTLAVIKAILTKAGVQFTEENGDSPGVRLLNRAQNTHIKTVSHDTRADKANRERATLTGAQLRAARALVRVSAAQLAQRAML